MTDDQPLTDAEIDKAFAQLAEIRKTQAEHREFLAGVERDLTERIATVQAFEKEVQERADAITHIADLTLRSSAHISAKEPIPPDHAAELHRALLAMGPNADDLERVDMFIERAERGDDWANQVLDNLEAGE